MRRITLLALAVVSVHASAHVRYRVEVIGDNTFGIGLSNAGEAVGFSGTYGPWSYSAGTLRAVPGLTRNGLPIAVNSSGVVVGENAGYGFVYDPSTGQTNQLPNQARRANAVNDAGQIVGGTTTGGVYLYSAGTMKDLGTFGSSSAAALSINEHGVIAGAMAGRAFTYDTTTGSLTYLPQVSGDTTYAALDINDNGDVVGRWQPAFGVERSFVYSSNTGTVADMGTLGFRSNYVWQINNSGEAVGQSNRNSSTPLGYVYDAENGLLRLDRLVDSAFIAAGWKITDARAINNAGQILALGDFQGRIGAALLLTPDASLVPEPGSVVLMVLGLFGVVSATRKHARESR